MASSQRRLTAIVFTDVVRFTTLAQRDEASALELLRRQTEVVEPAVADHRGRIVKSLGDGYLIEFGSALDAFRFARHVQNRLASSSLASADAEPSLSIRIGIHLGDVEVVGSDILGDAVNIAARVLRMADPGGVCATEDAYRQVGSHRDFVFHPLGSPPLKHINRHIELFRMEVGSDRIGMAPNPSAGIGTIAVLPFANLSSDVEIEHFCDGLAEELINALTHVGSLKVVSRTTSFAFKGRDLTMREVSEVLGVGAIVEGSVRKFGNRIRVAAQLIDVESDTHLWSNIFERELEDIFTIQSDLAEAIVTALKIAVTPQERERLARSGTSDIHAYELYLQGLQQFWRFSITGLRAARSLFLEAVAIDPHFVQAYSALAQAAAQHFFFWGDYAMYDDARKSADKLMQIAPTSAEAAIAEGLALLLREDFEAASKRFIQGAERDPQSYDAWYVLARCRFAQGLNREAVEAFLKAADIRLDDYQCLGLAQVACRAMGDEIQLKQIAERSIPVLIRSRKLRPDDPRAAYFEASAHTVLGDRVAAEQCLHHAISLGPHDPSILYNAACVYCLLGRHDESLSCLERVAEIGFSDYDWLQHDGDLMAVRSDPRFSVVLKTVGENRSRALAGASEDSAS